MAEKPPEKKSGPGKVIPFRRSVRVRGGRRKNDAGSRKLQEPILNIEAMLSRLGLCGAD